MGVVEDAVDAAAEFIGPFLDKKSKDSELQNPTEQPAPKADQLVEQALCHLEKINAADKAKDPNAPYDGSLVGVVYGLLDLITSLGILPWLPPQVTFGQRPRSVLVSTLPEPDIDNEKIIFRILEVVLPISEQEGSGIHPLIVQRVLPDIISVVAVLALSPQTQESLRTTFQVQYERILASTPISRLLPILTSYLQQDIPAWLRQRLAKDLAMVPLRPHGVRHIVEFLSLSYLSKNSQVPQNAGGSQSQIPVPVEAISQAARLLASVPNGMDANAWFTQLAPQLWTLLDGTEGVELSRAAGQIIAGGILNRKSTGAPGALGWELFARPVLQAINPGTSPTTTLRQSTSDHILVDEQTLELALKRLSLMVSSWSHVGVIRRLISPVLLSLWGLMEYARSRPSLDKRWTNLPRSIMVRFISIACDPEQVDSISTNLAWDGEPSWTFGAGSQGGVEIRARKQEKFGTANMSGLFPQIQKLDGRVASFISLLDDAKINDDAAGAIFVRITQRWLSTGRSSKESKPSLLHEEDVNPLSALSDAKLSEVMATKFKDKFARSPQHIIELMGQLLQNFVEEYKARSQKAGGTNKPSRATLGDIVQSKPHTSGAAMGSDIESEELVSFALSILNTLVTSSNFKLEESTPTLLAPIVRSLQYLSQATPDTPLSPLIINASSNLLQILQPSAPQAQEDPLDKHRTTLKTALTDLTSPDPPNRTWALSTLRKLIQDPSTFSLIDIPSTTHLLLSASVADPESYVHTAAIPVLLDLVVRAPNPTLRILLDAFIDIDERSLRLKKEQNIEQALDFRLRIGEILHDFVLENDYWVRGSSLSTRFPSLKMIVDAVLSIASRRGQRKETLSKRLYLSEQERKEQEEGEAAWGGPIPNLLDPEGENPAEQQERDALLKIVQGWEDTGIEEDVRIRASAMSILGTVVEKRLELLNQANVDAALQMVVQILVVETGVSKAILRRAAVLVVMGLLRSMDALLEEGRESSAGLKQTEELERVIKWVRDEDVDDMVKGHADNVVEGLETWRMKKMYKVHDEQFRMSANLGLEVHLQGLNVNPIGQQDGKKRGRPIVEEIE